MTQDEMQQLSVAKTSEGGRSFFSTTTMKARHKPKEIHCDNKELLYDFDKTKEVFCSHNKQTYSHSCDFMYFNNKGKIIFVEAKGVGDKAVENKKVSSKELEDKKNDTHDILHTIASNCNIPINNSDLYFYVLFTNISYDLKTKMNTLRGTQNDYHKKLKEIGYTNYLFCEDVDLLLKHKFLPK